MAVVLIGTLDTKGSEYQFVRDLLQLHGLVDKCSGRGRYLRRRERRPLPGMLLHLDASTHEWVEGLAQQDLVVATGRTPDCGTLIRRISC